MKGTTRLLTALAVGAFVIGAPTAHADDEMIGGEERVSYGPDVVGLSAEGDAKYAIEAYLEQDLNYFRCSTAMPPVCWKVSTLTYYTHVNLGYRRHAFKGKSAVTFGTLLWLDWYNKSNKVACRLEAGTACGDLEPVPVTRWWSDVFYYVPDQFPSPGFWRERYSGCVKQACSYFARRTVTIRCFAKQEQCYFVH